MIKSVFIDRLKRLLWLLEAAFIFLFALPIALLPLKAASRLGALLGTLVFHTWKARSRIAVENISKSSLRDIQPELLALKTFNNLGRSFVEVIKIYFGFDKKLLRSVSFKGEDNYVNAAAKDKGIIFLTGHCGNWELLAIALSAKGMQMATVARRQNNPYLNAAVERVRERYKNKVIYKKDALKGMLNELKKKRNVGILVDQSVMPKEGFVVEFLGRGAWTTKTPALIARKTGAALLPVFIKRSDTGHTVSILPEVSLSHNSDNEKAVMEDTTRFTSLIENYVRENPEEWLWIHRRWKRVA